jgi:hypothetical protein
LLTRVLQVWSQTVNGPKPNGWQYLALCETDDPVLEVIVTPVSSAEPEQHLKFVGLMNAEPDRNTVSSSVE